MINQLLITENDLPKLIGKLVLSKASNEHNLVFNNKKEFIFEKRLKVIVYTNGKYGLAKLHSVGYDIKFRTPAEFVEYINSRDEDFRFYSLVTQKELEQIHKWQIEDLQKL